MAKLEEVGQADQWRCWLCDEDVDRLMSVNDPRGPSVDAVMSDSKRKRKGTVTERLAHRSCNTKKGSIAPVVPWATNLFVVDAAPIYTSVERLERKGGREAMARAVNRTDAKAAADWLLDRVSRLAPDLDVTTRIEAGGGQFVVVLVAL